MGGRTERDSDRRRAREPRRLVRLRSHIELSAEMEKFHDDRVTYVPRRWEPIPNSVNLWGGQLPTWRKTSGTTTTGTA